MITVVYWSVVIIYSGIVLGIVGIDGANCEIQTGMGGFRSLYNITYWQEYAIIITSGYVGSLSILLVTMFVSAKTKSAVLAVIVPFILVFVPSFLSNINIPVIEKILGLLPDQLLQMKMVLTSLQLYHIGGRIAGGMEILLLLHTVLAVILCPVIYKTYKRIEVK